MGHIERMEVELKELKDKFYKGMQFLYSHKGDELLNEEQKELMSEQFLYMNKYCKVLEKRIIKEKEMI